MARITVQSVIKNQLLKVVPGDIIKMELPSGETMLAYVEPMTQSKQDILTSKYAALLGQPITVGDAAQKYGINRRTIFRWLNKGYIAVLEPEPVKLIDEGEFKYCLDIYRQRQRNGVKTGAPLLDDNGLPYELKRPELSEYRKRKKRQN